MSLPLISIVTPFYNEEQGILPYLQAVRKAMDATGYPYEIVCVNDGSQDQTLPTLLAQRALDSRLKIIDLSRNFGKEYALTAGLDYAQGGAVIPIDADLQDPPDLIADMLAEWQAGYKVVLMTRRSRDEGFWKSTWARLFYRVINRISDSPIPENTGDFRLIDRQALLTINTMRERSRFMKGLLSWPGFSTQTLYYDRPARTTGQPAQNYRRLFDLAIVGILSFSTLPLRIWTLIGLTIALLSFAYGAYLFARTLLFGVDVSGYASIMVSIMFLGGLQLMGLGIVGEYIGCIFQETKQRPLYVVNQTYL